MLCKGRAGWIDEECLVRGEGREGEDVVMTNVAMSSVSDKVFLKLFLFASSIRESMTRREKVQHGGGVVVPGYGKEDVEPAGLLRMASPSAPPTG